MYVVLYCHIYIAVDPTFPELLRLKVPETVAAKVYDFGVFLLDDKRGITVRNIVSKHPCDSVAAARDILELWLVGKGVSVDWKSLVETLRDLDLNVLARDIEEYVENKK